MIPTPFLLLSSCDPCYHGCIYLHSLHSEYKRFAVQACKTVLLFFNFHRFHSRIITEIVLAPYFPVYAYPVIVFLPTR